jgi:hypothetical protein
MVVQIIGAAREDTETITSFMDHFCSNHGIAGERETPTFTATVKQLDAPGQRFLSGRGSCWSGCASLRPVYRFQCMLVWLSRPQASIFVTKDMHIASPLQVSVFLAP